MGYNTVAFLLNDFLHELERSPKTLLFALTHPPHGDALGWREQVDAVARESGEPRLHHQALEILPTFHADWMQFLVAGGNRIERLNIVDFGTTDDGKKTVTLELPKWWRR